MKTKKITKGLIKSLINDSNEIIFSNRVHQIHIKKSGDKFSCKNPEGDTLKLKTLRAIEFIWSYKPITFEVV